MGNAITVYASDAYCDLISRVQFTIKYIMQIIGYCNPGVSNSNPFKDPIKYQKCSECPTLKQKWPCGPQFLEEGR